MSVLRFEPFELDVTTGELRKHGQPVRLQPQPIKVLALLAVNAGRLVTREELHAQIWSGDTFVDFEQGLNYCIKQIRAALGDDAKAPTFVETLQRRGYRFIATVERVAAPAGPAAGKVVMAVLPFENLSGDPDQEYFSDGLTEEMIAQLGRLNPQRLGVIARTSALQYKRTPKGIDVIGRELGVAYVLEGTVRRSGDQVRVTAQLIQVSDQTHMWVQSFDRNVGDILALQSEVARAIADEIRVQLTPQEERRLASVRPVDPAAYEEYLKGRYFWNRRTRESLDKSVRHFEGAIERHPQYAAAYAGLADTYLTLLDYNYLPPRDAFSLAGRAVLESLRLDDALAEPHTSLGHLRFHEFNWHAAEEEFSRAIELNASYGTAHYYRGNLLAALGRFEEALREAQGALELDPMSANTRQNRLFLFYLARRYDEALEQAIEALEIDSSLPNVHYFLGLIYERLGRYREATASFERINPVPAFRGSTVSAAFGYAQAKAGNRTQALEVLTRLEELAGRQYVSSYDLALLSLVLGQTDDAFAHLARAHDEYSSFLPFVNVDARFDGVRSDPRFKDLVRRLKFPTRPEMSRER
jgi:TolB-like protein/Tfp pilus assembly protein PilF